MSNIDIPSNASYPCKLYISDDKYLIPIYMYISIMYIQKKKHRLMIKVVQ